MALRELSNYEKLLKFRMDASFNLPSDKKFVWFQPDPKEETFVTAEVVKGELDDMSITIKGPDGNTGVYKNGLQVFPRNPIKFDGCEDMAELGYLNEPSVLHNMRLRYNADIIHTYSGLFCVIVNPYKWIQVYTQEMIEVYTGKRRNEVAPHVFAVADGAYRSMLQEHQNQSMLITGESGAGKTENTKKVIQYIATIAGRAGGGGQLEQQIIQCNPILETFGNAKTNRNNNSSRFGKFIELQFNDGGLIAGASITSYLLEKSRVVWQAENERSFHCFYQVTKAATEDERAKWSVPKPEKCGFINKSNCYDVRGIDDFAEYSGTKEAMMIMGFNQEDIDNVFSVIAGITHLGNIEFAPGRGESCTVSDRTAVSHTAELLQVDAQGLESGLIEPRIKAGNAMVKTALSAQKAKHSQEALAKAVFGRLFLWIIKKINEIIARARRTSFIGVLDIAGFEIFPYNTFEQLCINYTNEKLQQFFNNHMFKLEQEEYIREKINWTFIDFGMDSQATIDLIEAKAPPGILALLDSACYANLTDDRFLQQLQQSFGKAHPKFGTPKFSKTAFEVVHYAGRVAYETAGWIDKNKDPLQNDLQIAMVESKNQFVARLFTDRHLAVAGQSGSAIHSGGAKTRGANFITVGAHHKEGLNSLMKTLYATNPHFIRCILPNSKQEPGRIEDKIVLDQLRCNGVLEGIRISRKGFPNRVTYPEFVKRYYLMVSGIPRSPADPRAATEAILTAIKPKDYSDGPAMKPETPYRFGLTKVFFRAGTLAWIEEQREKKIGDLIVDIQNSARAWVARRMWKSLREQTVAAKIIQQNLRAWIEFKNWPWWKLYQKARPLLKRRNFEKEIEEREAIIADLRKQIAERDHMIKDLQAQLGVANKKIDELTQKYEAEVARKEALEDELDEMEKAKAQLNQQIADLQEDLADEKAHGVDLQRQREALEAKLNSTQESLAAEQRERANLESVKKNHERELEEAASKAKANADAIARLEDQKNKLQTEVEEIAAASKDVSKALEAARKKSAAETASLQSDLDTARARGDDLEKQKAALSAEIKGLQQNLEDERETVRNQKAEAAKLSDEIAATKRALDSANESLEKTKGQVKALQKEKEEISQQAGETEDALDQLNRQKIKLQDQIDSLTSSVDQENSARRAAEKKISALETTLRDVQQKLAAAEAQTDDLYLQAKQRGEEAASLRADLDSLDEKYQKLSKDKKATDTELTALKDENLQLDSKVKSLQRKLNELHVDMDALEKEAAEAAASSNLRDQLAKVTGQLTETKALLDVANGNVRKMEEGKKTLKKEFDELNALYEEEQQARQAAERMKKNVETELEEANEKIEQIERSKKALEKRIKETPREVAVSGGIDEAELKKYLSEIQSLKDLIEDEQAAKGALEKRMTSAIRERDDALLELEDTKDALDREKKRNRSNEAELEDLRDNLEDAEEAKVGLEEEKRRKDIENEDLKRKLELEVEARERLEQSVKDLNTELEAFKSGEDALSKMKNEYERKLRRLEGDLDDANVRLEAELKAKHKLEQSNKKLTADYADARRRLGDEATTRAGSENSMYALEEELDSLRAKFDTVDKAKAVLEKTNKTLETQLEELRGQLDEESRSRSRLEKQKRSLENELEEVKEQLDEAEEAQTEAEDSRKKVELELEDMRRIVERESEQRDQFEEAARKFEREAQALRDRLAEEEVGRSAAERAKKKLETENEEVTRQLDAEQKARVKIEKAKRQLEQEVKDLRDTTASTSRTVTAESAQAAKLAEDVKRLKAQLAEETERAGAAEGAKRRFQLENQNLHDDVGKLEAKVNQMKTELEELRKEKEQQDARIRAAFGGQ